MRAIEVEGRVRERLDRAARGAPIEDSAIELKRAWPAPKDLAMRLAGHANAAGGDPIIWVIGAQEDGATPGAAREELANLWPQVQACFESGFAPGLLRDVVIAFEGGGSVVALAFTTDQAPYVVQSGDLLAVKWREGTRVRDAKRHELLRMVLPSSKRPTLEAFTLTLAPAGGTVFLGTLGVEAVPRSPGTWLLMRGAIFTLAFDGGPPSEGASLRPGHGVVEAGHQSDYLANDPVRFSPAAIALDGPALMAITANFAAPYAPLDQVVTIHVELSFRLANSEERVRLRESLSRIAPRGPGQRFAKVIGVG